MTTPNITWRALPAWPYSENERQADRFKATRTATLNLLRSEVEAVGGSEVLIGVVTAPGNVRMNGAISAEAKYLHPGAEVSFDKPDGHGGQRRLTFHTDTFRDYVTKDSFESNLRAIALGLEALRRVDRYGITTSGQQYAGFAQLAAGPGLEEQGRLLVERWGSVKEALRHTHPDTGDTDMTSRDYQAVIAFRETQAVRA